MTLPASDSYDTYGGELVDYSAVEDPTTDLPASASNQARASSAALTNTAFRAIMVFYIDASNNPVIKYFNSVWDNDLSDAPTISYVAAGTYDIEFPATVVDLRGQTQNLNLLGAWANPDVVNGNGYLTTVNKTGANTFRVYNWSFIDLLLEDMGAGANIMISWR